MQRSRFSLILGSIAAAFCSFTLAVDRALDRMVAFAIAILAPDPRPQLFLAGGPALALDAPGSSLDPALTQQMRHEAGVPRRAAPRNV